MINQNKIIALLGADQVAAVEECYKYAQLSAQKSTTFEEGMLEVYFLCTLYKYIFYFAFYNFINILL